MPCPAGGFQSCFSGLDPGIRLATTQCTIRGLVINRFGLDGIQIDGGGSHLIVGNYIGTDVAGTTIRANLQEGIYVSGSSGNVIGGTSAADRNVISGNGDAGIYILYSSGTLVRGNYIGTTANGLAALGNVNAGVLVNNSPGNTIGGAVACAGNVISGNGNSGVFILNPDPPSTWSRATASAPARTAPPPSATPAMASRTHAPRSPSLAHCPAQPAIHLQALSRTRALRLLHRAARSQDLRRAHCRRPRLVPPKEYDPDTAASLSEMVEVGTAGVVRSWAWVSRPREKQPLSRPFAYALIQLDGAATPLCHAVDAGSESKMRTGMRVRARWKPETVGAITDIACFEPE